MFWAKVARLGAEPNDRTAFALHYLADAGRGELSAMLASGCYRINMPEEGAMLAITALLARGASEDAARVVDAIAPYLDRLRFFPHPSSRAMTPVATVHVVTVGEARAKIRALSTPIEVLRMNESLTVWAPLTDRAVALLLETVNEGAPGSVVSADWRRRAEVLIADHTAARTAHRLCKRPHHPKRNLAILLQAAQRLVAPNTALSPRELASFAWLSQGILASTARPRRQSATRAAPNKHASPDCQRVASARRRWHRGSTRCRPTARSTR